MAHPRRNMSGIGKQRLARYLMMRSGEFTEIVERESGIQSQVASTSYKPVEEFGRDREENFRGKGKETALSSGRKPISIFGSFFGSLKNKNGRVKNMMMPRKGSSTQQLIEDEQDYPERDDYFAINQNAEDPFKTPPTTPSAGSARSRYSPVTNSPDSMDTSSSYRRRETKRARLKSRVKTMQILGVEAREAITQKFVM